jgi:RNA polymerase sigma factor (sigma-70 family)
MLRSHKKKFNAQEFHTIEQQWLKQDIRKLSDADLHQCKEDVLNGMRPYVESLVQSMARRERDPVEDLSQVGCIGVLKALEHYDYRKGASFKSYASFYVSGEIRRYLREYSLAFKAPRALQELYYRLNITIKRFLDTHGRAPSDAELLETLKCEPKDLRAVLDLDRRAEPLSFEEIILPNEQRTQQQAGTIYESFGRSDQQALYIEELMDVCEAKSNILETETKLLLKNALSSLKPELKDVVLMTYFEDMPQHRIAEKSGVSQMQISRRLKKALQQLSGMLNTPL